MRFIAAFALILVLLAGADAARAEDGELTVALTGKYPPFSFHDDAGELAGFDVDVSRAVAERLGRPVRFVATEWDGILAGLLAGKYDVIIGSMAITPERAERVHFTRPYYRSGAQLFIHRDDRGAIRSLGDLEGERVGVVLGETFEQFLRTRHPEIDTATYKSTVDVFQDVKNRRLRGFVTDRLVGLHQVKSAAMPFVPAGPLLYTEEMAIPVRHGDERLLESIDEALAEMERDGTLRRLEDRWFGLESGGAAVPEVSTGLAARRLLGGFAKTLIVALASLALGFLLALPTGVILHRGAPLVRWPLRAIVDFIRGTPVLIQLFFVYYGLGSESIGLSLSPMSAAILTLTVNAGAYVAEVVRSGLLAVPAGQARSARALGLSRLQTFRFVVWPQAFRVAMPSLMNSAVALLKDTALVSVISVAEVIREAQSLISVTFDPVRYYLIVAVLFFVVTYPLMKLAGRLEARMRRRGYTHA
jgi:His/Glu/Gln/Arg/opine family amino acid ABC transporter permease subunit